MGKENREWGDGWWRSLISIGGASSFIYRVLTHAPASGCPKMSIKEVTIMEDKDVLTILDELKGILDRLDRIEALLTPRRHGLYNGYTPLPDGEEVSLGN